MAWSPFETASSRLPWLLVLLLLPCPSITLLAQGDTMQRAQLSNATDAHWAEALALMAFKEANIDLGGCISGWNITREDFNRFGPQAVCKWPGVTCDNSTHFFTSVSLSLGRLCPMIGKGNSIPPQFGDLAHLQALDLSDCGGLDGPIPPDLGRCTSLTDLRLSSNLLSGPIPTGLSALTGLLDLWLDGNSLSGSVPSTLSTLTKLSCLKLDNNVLVGPPFPPWIQSLRQLQYYGIGQNSNITGPISGAVFSSLQHLQVLSLQGVDVMGSSLPSEMGLLTGLVMLDLQGCEGVTGGVPPSFSALRSLTLLQVSFVGYPPMSPEPWSHLSNLCVLRLSGLKGPLPLSLGQVGRGPDCQQSMDTPGTVISITDSQLEGSIPAPLWAQFCNESRGMVDEDSPVVSVSFEGGGLTGLLPELGPGCSSLQEINLGFNNLTGLLPDETTLYAMSALRVLDLQSNNLYGSIPQGLLTALSSLSVLSLANNNLTGGVPPLRCDYDLLLTAVELGGNFLTGNINEALSQGDILSCAYLSVLGLEDNQLTGSFPAVLMKLPRLTEIKLDRNKLSGPITMRGMPCPGSLRSVSLSRNNFSGSLPSEWGSCDSLSMLNVSSNHLEGAPPASLGQLSSLTSLDLSNNQFSGSSFLDSLGNATNLAFVDLSNNLFSGSFPESLTRLAGLTYLNLMGLSRVQGPLPAGLAAMPLVELTLQPGTFQCPTASVKSCPIEPASGNVGAKEGVNGSSPFCQDYCQGFCEGCLQSQTLSPPQAQGPSSATLGSGDVFAVPPAPAVSSGGLSAGAIAGIVVGCVVALGLALAAVWLMLQHQTEVHDLGSEEPHDPEEKEKMAQNV